MTTTALRTVETARAGDRERERTANDLGQALTQGYLTMPEYEDRLQSTFQAHTAGELRRLVADLPVSRLRRQDPRRRAAQQRAARLSVRIHLAAYLAGALLMLGIWLAVGLGGGGWYFWPVWPIMGWGIGVASHAIPVRLTVR
ncbi:MULTISPECIES: DUF1707 domain-containing protein [unclassified Mycolicibacterium]|uniref:DUF1707 domain-containing protein n=1 Tax=unclassified Mycolicibacterium TaxID=2636767 RepID=UPI0012DF2E5D|nr:MULTISPECIES: DUF1707 domain-containing protein [unclassified Mycolicibacterium]MUL81821.1 DUF1707 domain-containing protein [Mycolicibacterium sp. CBMA 329]MUL87587.1 DUF1707 domain-containing protein [Mycolicibacterium sp. CBMA 331]MUL99549.1 DUF1707 domain-containing protein [Mycolicibacterium sp. CBMA 334]MUM26567.1 DUF1707 domain-containing protein [Mycolicibacterium sp. CBMA 295]MUM37884.1 DUF1707 domain-containing protein [Mycolicibacterium sp. CBMA 247]